MSKVKLALLTLAVAGLSLGFAACGGDDDGDGEAPEDASFELQIGDLVPLTGDLSSGSCAYASVKPYSSSVQPPPSM